MYIFMHVVYGKAHTYCNHYRVPFSIWMYPSCTLVTLFVFDVSRGNSGYSDRPYMTRPLWMMITILCL